MTSIKLQFLFALSQAFIAVVNSEYSCDVLLPLAKVYCISPTEFTVTQRNCSSTIPIYSCPNGSFCTDTPEVCTVNGPPACKLSKQCNVCSPNALSTCVNSRQYVTCIDGSPDINMKNCQASKPYCSMEHLEDGNVGAVCTNFIDRMACANRCPTEPEPTDPPPTEPPPTDPPPTDPPPTECPPPVEECANNGKFKFTVDITGDRNICGASDCNGDEQELHVNVYASMRTQKAYKQN